MNKKSIQLFGDKRYAIFDWWSFGHAALYFVLTELYLESFGLERALLTYVILAYAWEIVERWMEDFVHTKRFFAVKEGWINRYVGDIISGLIGFFIAYYWV